MGFFKKSSKKEDTYFPVPRPEQFVPLVLPDSQKRYGFNNAWLERETRSDTSPLGSCVMAIAVMAEPMYRDYIDKVVENVEIVVAEKMNLKESQDFVGQLARSAEIGGALAFMESMDHVTPVGKMHPSVWNALVFHTFENKDSEETEIQLQARFCAALVGYYLIWETFPTAQRAAQTIKPVIY